MQHANGTANVFNLIFQIPTSVVTAGGIPTSAIGRSVANFSGHILKLVPGDFNYAFPLFPIVIIWNGETKFTPTQFTKANAICSWKLGIIDRHLSEAINLFEEVEGDLKNPTLNQSFNYLWCQVVETKQILGYRVKGISHTIPPVSYGPRSGTTSDLTYQFPKGYVPTPFIRHDIDPSVGDPQPLPPKSTQQSIAPPESETPAETPLATGRLFLGFTPHPYWQQCTQDFFLPLDLPMGLPMVGSQLSSQLFRSQTQTQTIPDKSISTTAHPYNYIPSPDTPVPTWLITNPNRPIPNWLITISNNSILIPSNTIILSYILSNPNIPTPNCSIQTNSFNQTKSSIFHSYILLQTFIYSFPPT